MKLAASILLGVLLAAPRVLSAQASALPSAAPPSSMPPGTEEQRGKALLDRMVTALGGDAWLNRKTLTLEGRTAAFFQGAPDPGVIPYRELRRFAASGQPPAVRYEFTKKRDIVQIWTDTTGTEITYKGIETMPKEQLDDMLRRIHHSIEEVVFDWLKQPGVVVVAEGASMVGRRAAEKVSVLTANNDAVTIELDSETNLPLRRTFEWRNTQFKDHDEEAEEYDDYHVIQGIPTPFTITRYKNGEMLSQRYIVKATYNEPLAPSLFDTTIPLHGKKK